MADLGDTAWLEDGLTAILRATLSAPHAAISAIAPLPGHAGLGFSFTASLPAGARRFVVRTIEAGTPAKGPADVVRQARIMQSLHEAGVPTPRMVSFGDETSPLGRPYFIGEFVEGYQTPADWRLVTDHDRQLGRRAMAALTLIHRADWRSRQEVFGAYQDLETEFERLRKLYDRPTIDIAEGGRLVELQDRLVATIPRDATTGCVHGDFHWGNIIFGEDEVRAILDWEISFIGPTLLDVGWIAFYADGQSFSGAMAEGSKRFGLTPEELVDAYQAACAAPVPTQQIAWFRAFSAYRYGIISLFNCMLHRRGKRHDPMWEDVIQSVPQMMERGLEVLGSNR